MIAYWENECISRSCLRGPGSVPDRGGIFQGIYPWLITDTWRGDGHRQVIIAH